MWKGKGRARRIHGPVAGFGETGCFAVFLLLSDLLLISGLKFLLAPAVRPPPHAVCVGEYIPLKQGIVCGGFQTIRVTTEHFDGQRNTKGPRVHGAGTQLIQAEWHFARC